MKSEVTRNESRIEPETGRPEGTHDDRAIPLLRRIWQRWARAHIGLIGLNLAFIAVFSAVNGLYAPIIKIIVDQASTGKTGNSWILLAALAVTVVKAVALLAHKRINVRLFTRISLDIQRALYAKMIDADVAWHGREPAASLAQRIMADVGEVRLALERVVNNAIRDVLMIVAVVASMLYIDWQLSLIALIVFPVAIWPISRIGRSLRKIGRETQASIGAVSARLLEGLSSIEVAKTYQLEARLNEQSRDELENLRRLQVRAGDRQALIEPLMEVLGGIVIVGVLFFVGWRLEAGQNTLGDFAGFITALLLAGQPLRALGNLTGFVQRGLAATQRIFQVLDEPPRIVDRPGAAALEVSEAAVVLDNATFRYDAHSAPALDGVSLEIPGGSRIALVGRSGAGKSTLFNLIPRLFDPTGGRVLIDGQDIREVSLASLRAHIALVTQHSILFNDTVRANIAIGVRGGDADAVGHKRIEAASRAAAAHDFIMDLPQGYDTVIGVGGDRLSGGQRQRLSIARAFLRDAPILLLDEATSALDAEAEALVRSALDRLARGRTTIVIAHRLSTIMDADRIAVLDRGRLVEIGDHAALMTRDGVYASLFRLQFKDVIAEPGTRGAAE